MNPSPAVNATCQFSCATLDPSGQQLVPWIAQYFGACVYSPRQLVAFWIGMSSLGFWICCQAPQFIENCRRGSASALSVLFIIEWATGDITNLVGALLSNQLPTQIYTAVLFITMDTFMIAQLVYYSYCKKSGMRRPLAKAFVNTIMERDAQRLAINREDDLQRSVTVPAQSDAHRPKARSSKPCCSAKVIAAVVVLLVVGALVTAVQTVWKQPPPAHHAGDCSGAQNAQQALAGTVCGWVSATIYLNSRVPQILKNFKEKRVDGLSPVMFICAVMGNVTYAIGVLLRSTAAPDVVSSLPWLLGSIGTLAFDFTIVIQLFYYGGAHTDDPAQAAVDASERAPLLADPDIPISSNMLVGDPHYTLQGPPRPAADIACSVDRVDFMRAGPTSPQGGSSPDSPGAAARIFSSMNEAPVYMDGAGASTLQRTLTPHLQAVYDAERRR